MAWDDPEVEWERYRMVIVRTTWDYSDSEHVAARFRAWLRRLRAGGVHVYNDARLMTWNISKRYLQELHEEAGIATIPTLHVVPGQPTPDLSAIISKHGWRQLVIKPCISGGSRDSIRVDGNSPESVARGQHFLHAMLTTGVCHEELSGAVEAEPVPQPSDSVAADGGSEPQHLVHLHRLPSRRSMKLPSPEEAAAMAMRMAEAAGKAAVLSPSTSSMPALVPAPALPPSAGASAADGSGGANYDAAFPPLVRANSGLSSAHRCAGEMLIQPYIQTVEEHGEISVLIVDGKPRAALAKKPRHGDFRVQASFGGSTEAITLTAEETTFVEKILQSAKQIVEAYELPSTPLSPAQSAHVLPRVLPSDGLLCGRVDMLRLTPKAYADVFEDEAVGLACDSVPSSDPRSSSDSPIARVSPQSSPLLLLELEVIEPCMYFRVYPHLAEEVADAIGARLKKLAACK
ncbi:hypothetical protein EON66_04455 [archaeon]|nr:MAG: hypothetical protein EON66_04455 [archaeon]